MESITPPIATSAPWYRHRWPWFLISGPLIVAIAGFITLGLAAHNTDGLVADDYFKRGKEINADLTRDLEAARLGLSATVALDRAGKLTVQLQSPHPLPHLNATFAHATQSGRDVQARLSLVAPGTYAADLAALPTGKWHVILTGPDRKWRLMGTARSTDGTLALALAPATP
ncbi:MAG: FixH family protein [Betaproteobacteria bacterium]|nr:FixH family protein [Betaproteobacteria bacterium]